MAVAVLTEFTASTVGREEVALYDALAENEGARQVMCESRVSRPMRR
jgi:hypothetical protein